MTHKVWSAARFDRECVAGEKLMQELAGKVIAEVRLSMTGVTITTTDGIEIGGGGESSGIDYPDGSFITNIMGRYHLSTTFVEED